MFAKRVGDEPIRAARNLRGEIRITGGGHFEGGGADDGVVGDDGERGGAWDGLLEAVDDHGGTVGGVTVNRGGGGDAEVAVAFGFRGGEFRQIVDGSGSDGDGGLSFDDFTELRNVAVVGMKCGFDWEDVWFILRNASVFQQLEDLFTGGLPCIFIRDDDGRLAGPEFFDVFGDVFKNVVAEHAEFGLKTFGNCDDAHDLFLFVCGEASWLRRLFWSGEVFHPVETVDFNKCDKAFENLIGKQAGIDNPRRSVQPMHRNEGRWEDDAEHEECVVFEDE